MSTASPNISAETIPHPVDSSTCPACRAIGSHAEGCPRRAHAVTIAQAAPLLGMTPWQVRALCEAGSLPGAVKLNGGPWAIPAASVAAAVLA